MATIDCDRLGGVRTKKLRTSPAGVTAPLLASATMTMGANLSVVRLWGHKKGEGGSRS